MHADELRADEPLVRRLLSEQFPQWADLPLAPVDSTGTSNAIFRLGADMCVRLPRLDSSALQVEKEQRWLPTLAPFLPLRIPRLLGSGVPAEGYPWVWSVYDWLDGTDAFTEPITDLDQAAADLAHFVAAMRRIDATGGPPAGKHNFYRGTPLAWRDTHVRNAITSLEGLVDTSAVTAVWDDTLRVPQWDGPPVWVHGDIHSGNLLVVRGRISAVIDFGGLGVGDPACDMIVAWSLLTNASRDAFRAALAVDDATWARGRGWALSVALLALPYYLHTNPIQVQMSRRVITEVLADYSGSAGG